MSVEFEISLCKNKNKSNPIGNYSRNKSHTTGSKVVIFQKSDKNLSGFLWKWPKNTGICSVEIHTHWFFRTVFPVFYRQFTPHYNYRQGFTPPA